MKPVLIVEGKRLEVIEKHLIGGKVYKVKVFENNPMESTTYYDVNYNEQHVEGQLKINLVECLIDEDKLSVLKTIISDIEELLVKNSNELKELSIEHTEACLIYPHTEDYILRKYELVKHHQMGLMDAQEIVTEYMYDDADLQGGVDDEQNQPF